MNSQTLGLRVAGAIFGVVCVVHLLRLLTCVEVTIAGWQMPLWLNVVGAIVTGGLSDWLWRLSRNAPKS